MDIEPLLDELRVLAANGLHYADDEWERERWERVAALTSEYTGAVVDLPPREVRERYARECGHVTTKVGAGVVVGDDEGRALLQQRAGSGEWGIPGGWVEPGEAPERTAVREAREETGLDVELDGLIGVYTRSAGEYGLHGQIALPYRARVVGGDLDPSHESAAVAYRDPDAVESWHADHERMVRDGIA